MSNGFARVALSLSPREVVNTERAFDAGAQYSISNLANGCSHPDCGIQAVSETPSGGRRN